MKIIATTAVAAFNCLQSDCPDTCCRGWSMQLDDATYAAYKGTELENAVAHDGKYGEIRVMKRDPETDYCVKFTDGICAIHKEQGAPLLGDACNFYPRITRRFGEETVMTATLSCPEITRLSLFNNSADPELVSGSLQEIPEQVRDMHYLVEIQTERLPSSLTDYQEEPLTPGQCIQVHQHFMNSCIAELPAEQIMARIYSTAGSISRIDKKDWPDASSFFLKTADSRLPKPITDAADKYKILQIFAAIFHATKKKMTPRLAETLAHAEKILGAKIEWDSLNLALLPTPAITDATADNQILKNYLAAQLSFSAFPFAGLGDTPLDKAKLLTFKFALTKLLITGLTEQTAIIQAIQSSARIIDHIASPELIFNLMDQFGWNTEARIIGLSL